MKNKYMLHGEYTISFDVEVIAESEDEAIEMADDINFWESSNNGIFADGLDEEVNLNADGCIDNVNAELIEKDVEDDYEEE